MTATLAASFTNGVGGDVDSDGKADPGDTINYTAVLSASGGGATGLSFNVALDSHTTIVGGTLNSTPVAFDQSLNTNEDTGVNVTIQGQDPDGSNLTFNNISVPAHGSLGAFSAPSCDAAGICSSTATYTPAADYNGSDSFTFKVNDGTANSNETGTVSITVNPVNDAPTFTVPGNPSAVNEDVGAVTVSNYITGVRPGNTTDTLENGQTVSFVISNNTNPGLFSSAPALNVNAGSYPKTANLTYTPAANQNGTAIITYHAHDNGGTSPGVDNSADQTFTITVNAVNDAPVVPNKNYSAQANMKITGLTGLLTGVTDADTGTGSPACSPTFVVKSGSFSATSPAGGTISNPNLSTGTFDFDPPPGVTGNVTFTYVVSDNGCPGVADSAPVTVTVAVAGPVIWFVSTTGANPAAAGDGRLSSPFTRLDQATTAIGVNTNQRIFVFTGTNPTVAGTTVTLQGNNTAANQAAAQVQAQWLIGQGTVASGFDSFFGITPPAGTIARPALSNVPATANGMRPTIQGTVTMKENTVVQGLNINVSAGATKGLTASGLTAGTSTSLLTIKDVNVTSAGGNAVDISGGSPTNNSVQYTTSDGTNSPNILVSTTGTALSVVNTTIGASGLTFRSISSNGASSGIVLNNTGASGGLTVTGNSSGHCGGIVAPNAVGTLATITAPDTADCTGGTIQASTGIGVSLNSTSSVSLTRMRITGNGDDGINGTTVTGLSLASCLIENNAPTSATGEGLKITGLFGTSAWTNTTFKGSGHNNAWVHNDNGTLTSLSISGTNFTNNAVATGNDGLLFEAFGTSVVTSALVNNCNFGNNEATGIQALFGESGVVNSFIVTNTSFTDNNIGMDFSGGDGTVLTGARMKFKMQNNTIINPTKHTHTAPNTTSQAINVNMAIPSSGTDTLDGKIDGNVIGTSAIAGSGSSIGNGMRIIANSNGHMIMLISNNTIRECPDGFGMQLWGRNGVGTAEFTVVNNNVNHVNTGFDPGTSDFPLSAISIESITATTQGFTTKADVRGNTVPSGTAFDLLPTFIEVFKNANSNCQLVDNAPASANGTAELTESHTNPAHNNTGSASANAGVVLIAGPLTQPAIASLQRINRSDLGQANEPFQNGDTGSLISFLSSKGPFASIFENLTRAAQSAQALPSADSVQQSWLKAEAAITGENNGSNVAVSASLDRSVPASSLAGFVTAVESLIVPTVYAEERAGVTSQESGVSKAEVRGQGSWVRAHHARSNSKLKTENSKLSSAGVRGQWSGVRAHHVRSNSKVKTENLKLTTVAPMLPTPIGSFPINGKGTGAGFTLPAGKTTTITFKATLNTPPNLSGVPPGTPQVSAQGTLTGAFAGNPIVTDDPSVGGTTDPTVTPVDLFDTTTTLGAVPSAGSWNVGQTITFTATVAPNPANATVVTGIVVFKDNGTPIAACNGATGVTVSSGSAQCVVTFGSGAHSVQAFYSGDGNYDPSTSNTLSQGAVNQSGTTTAVTSNLNPSLVTQSVTFTATVTSSTGFTGPPTGTVQFKDNLINLGSAQTLNGSGVATLTTSALVAGNHPITAVYSGDTNFTTSTGTLTGDPQVVNKSNTTTALVSSSNPVAPTVEVTYTATVTSATTVTGPPTGTVTFNDGVNPIVCTGGSQTLNGSGVATCKFTYPDTSGSPHDISAVYGGDATFNGSTSNHVSETVTACATNYLVTSNLDDGSAGTLRVGIDTGVCDGGTITFDTAGVFATPQTITLATGELSVNKNLTITGPGAANLTISGNNASRIFNVASGKTVTISGMTITGGKVLGANGGAGLPGGSVSGGGIFNAGTLTLTNVIVSGNHATGGDGGADATTGGAGGTAKGGGIFSSGTLTLTNTSVNGSNSATGGKGGDSAGTNGNGGAGLGGGVYSLGTLTLTLTNSTISANTATGGAPGTGGTGGSTGSGSGGGVYNDGSSVAATTRITNSTISGNTASLNGGGIFNTGVGTNATLTITNSTISGNGANNDGGGIYNDGATGTSTLTSVTVTGNHADNDDNASGAGGGINVVSGTVTLKNTIVAGNLKGSSILQVETATVVGTIGAAGAGNAKVVVTADGMPNSPKTIFVAVANNDTASDVAGKMRTALTADTDVNGFFTVSGATNQIILTARTVAANDATLNIATDNDTCSGLTAAPTSADTTPGRTAHDISGTINTTASASTFDLIGDAASSGGLLNGTDNNIVGVSGAGVRHITTILNSTLANNGGPTFTHALVNNSPAIDKGSAFTLTTDQRGLPRPVDFDSTPTGPGDDSDIGAFERASPSVTITKGFNPTGITSGGTSTITLTLTNPNASPVTDGAFTDNLVNISAVGGPAGGTCVGASSNTVTAGTGLKSFSGITVPANSVSCTVTFDVTSTNLGANPNTTSGVSATGLPTGSASNTATLTVFSGTSIQKSFSPTAIQTGGTSTVTLTLTNTNISALTNASFTDNLVNINAVGGPAGGTCVGASSNTVTAGSGTKSFSGITIPGSGSGGTCTVTFNVTSTNAGDNPNQTSGVTTDQTTLGAPSNSATLTVLTAPSISKQFAPANIQTGGTSTVTLTLTNPNVLALNNASFTDTLVNMSAVAGNVTGTCSGTTPSTLSGGATALSFTGITIPGTGSGGSCTVIFDVTSSTLGTNPNTTSGVTTQQTSVAGSGSNTANLGVFAPPVVQSITRVESNPTSLSTVHFTVTFSKAVTGVDLTDFTLSTGGGLTGASVTGVTAGPSATYTVTVGTGTGDGTVRLNVIDDDTIESTDGLVLKLGGAGAGNGNFTTGDVYTVDRLNPFVSSITRAGSNPTNAASVDFTVTFSEAVSGVDITDFAVITSGLGGAPAVTNVVPGSGPSVTYTVTASTGTGNGTIKLKLFPDDDSIKDVVNKPLAPSPGTASGDGSFTPTDLAAKYDIDKTPPDVTINQAGTQTDPVTGPTASTVIHFTAVFTKPVADFTNGDVSITGGANASVVNVSQIAPNDGTTYDVAVEGMTQSGTVIASIAAGVAHDSAGNGNTIGTFTDHTVTFNVDNFSTFEVNTTADTTDGSCDPLGTGPGNQDCTLREAINAANTDAGAETITFNSTVFAAPGPYTINLTGALPDLSTDMTISGPGAKVLTVKRNTAPNYRIFTIASGNVTIDALTISNGNSAGLPNDSGGGIIDQSSGTVNISNSTISGNSGVSGGAIAFGTVGGTVNITNSTISGNSATTGGGIYLNNFGATSVNITNTTISGNFATGDGGGIRDVNTNTLTFTHSTIANNRADNDNNGSGVGGGVLRGSGTVTLRNTIVAGNFNDASPSTTPDDISGTMDASSSFNLIGNGGAGGLVNGTNSNQVGVPDPLLNPLADNGGSTLTHSLQCTSPAIDKGKAFGQTTDQRGGTRPFDFADAIFPNAAGGDGSDIGAFETQSGGGCVPEAQSPNPQPTTNEDNAVSVPLKAVFSQNVQMTFSIDTPPTNGSLGAITGTTCTFNLSTTCTASVLYTPNPDYFGPDTFKFKATTNPGGLTSDPADVNVTINSVNDPPSFFLSPNQTVFEDAGLQTVANFANTISVGPANEAGQTYSFILQNNTNPGLFSAAPALDTAGTLTYTPAANKNGSATLTFVMKDSGGGTDTSAPRTFTINVASVNDAPTFTKGPNVVVDENAPLQTINNWATAISPGPPDESGQTVTFKVIDFTNPALFSFGPEITAAGTLSFTPAANASGSSVVTIALKDSGGTANGGVDTSPTQTFTITVREGGSLQFSASTYSVGESSGPATITITRTGGTSGTTAVQIATSNGTATAGSDYTAVSQTVTFNDGDTSKTVNIPITDDLFNEPNETVNLTLSGITGSGELGAPSTAVLTINDNDPIGGYLKFSSANYSVAEGGVATITVQRIGTLTQAVTVDYATSDNSVGPQVSCAPTPGNTLASSRCDFTSALGQITFGAGDGADKTFTVLINQDSYVEGPETLALTLSNPTGGANLVTPSTSTLTINDDVSEPGSNLVDDTNTFVEQLYRDFLNRPSDAPGKAFWVDNIDKCNDPARRLPGLTQAQCIEVQRINTAAAFFLSIEFQATGGTAYLTNKAAFGTLPTFLNFESDAQAVGRGYVFGQVGAEAILEANKVAYFNAFVWRSTFTAIYGGLTNAQYVDALIANTGVSFTSAERDALVNGLNGATETRATVLRKVTEKSSFRDAEFNRMFVLMEYTGFLRRDPDAAGFNFWLTKLNQFNGNFINAEMIKAFISSAEYRGRFGP